MSGETESYPDFGIEVDVCPECGAPGCGYASPYCSKHSEIKMKAGEYTWMKSDIEKSLEKIIWLLKKILEKHD